MKRGCIAVLAWIVVGAGCGACEDETPRFDETRAAAENPTPEPETEPPKEPNTPEPVPAPPMAEQTEIDFEGAPSPRLGHVAVFTGTHLVVFGGDDAWPDEANGYAEVDPHPLATGGRYDLSSNTWAPTARRGAPPARYDAVAVYTGSEMIVWGGRSAATTPVGTGGRYDPAADRWQPMSQRGAPSRRYGHSLIWTGSEAIVWGGFGPGDTPLGDGARYDPATDAWSAIGGAGAPSPRASHGAVWTGTEMIVWGGIGSGGELGDGARYDPAVDGWRSVSADGAPSGRRDPVAVWTGTEMIVWGGQTGSWQTRDVVLRADGGRYDPAADAWRPTSMDGAFTRAGARGVWTGDRLAVMGETNMDETSMYPGPDLGLYDPRSDSWALRGAWEGLERPVVMGDGELLVWGGTDGTNLMSDGARIRLP